MQKKNKWNFLGQIFIYFLFSWLFLKERLHSDSLLKSYCEWTPAMRHEMESYLLPFNHPLKEMLDQIFEQYRVLENERTFADAGFIILYHQPFSRIRVAKHSLLPGYLFKVYLDSDPYILRSKACWWRLTQRCLGAKKLRKLIKKKQLIHFIVPNKWLYPLPLSSLHSNHLQESFQPVILVVEDMNIVSLDESVQAWQSVITPHHLDELYKILRRGFASEYVTINIPFCKNGKFACVDTEMSKKHLDLEQVKNFISPEMQTYWEDLMNRKKKKHSF